LTSAPVTVAETGLAGVLLLTFKAFVDSRGFFVETFNARAFADEGLPVDFVQDNHSRSTRDVLRGLHFQTNTPQAKLVRPVRGRIFDVAADVRVGSPTFGRWVGVTLTDSEMQALWVPPGFAHGFCTLSEEADVLYKCTGPYDPGDEGGVRWDDAALRISWPIKNPLLSQRDDALPGLIGRTDLPLYME
jgi:dTDP-4-dehydrorhamnose 3,5-epimerase